MSLDVFILGLTLGGLTGLTCGVAIGYIYHEIRGYDSLLKGLDKKLKKRGVSSR